MGYTLLFHTKKKYIEDLHLPSYNAVQCGESQRNFRRDVLPQSSGLKRKPGKEQDQIFAA
jgi:hypothetical protein